MGTFPQEARREELVALGKITRTQGSAGAVRLLPFFSPVTRIEELRSPFVYLEVSGDQGQGGALARVEIESIRYHKQFIVLEFKEIADMNAAELLRDATVYTEVANLWTLEENQFFVYELVGLRVLQVAEEPMELGRVIAVEDGAAHDYLRVRNAEKEFLIPLVRAMVLKIDVARGEIEVDIPEGLTDL